MDKQIQNQFIWKIFFHSQKRLPVVLICLWKKKLINQVLVSTKQSTEA